MKSRSDPDQGTLFGLLADSKPAVAVVDESGAPQEVVELFERLALQVKRQGFRHYSARAILHRIRWHFHIERGRREFKCNNNWTPKMARTAAARYPELEGFFEFRSSPEKDEE